MRANAANLDIRHSVLPVPPDKRVDWCGKMSCKFGGELPRPCSNTDPALSTMSRSWVVSLTGGSQFDDAKRFKSKIEHSKVLSNELLIGSILHKRMRWTSLSLNKWHFTLWFHPAAHLLHPQCKIHSAFVPVAALQISDMNHGSFAHTYWFCRGKRHTRQ